MDNIEQTQIRKQQFVETEVSLGLNQSLFEAKFVYSQRQILSSNQPKYFLSSYETLPSQQHGLSLTEIKTIHAWASSIIFQAGKALRVPITTTVLAQYLTHFFYSHHSHLDYDIRDVVIGAMFLACKQEETLRKSYQIAIVFDYIFKAKEDSKRIIKILDHNSVEYTYIKNKVTKVQLDILFELGFQAYRLTDVPHRYIAGIITLFDSHPQKQIIVHQSWIILNDIFRTIVCLYYPPQILAVSAVYIAMKKNQISFPEVPWWCLMDATLSTIERIQVQLQLVYRLEKSFQLTTERVAQIINGKGKETLNVINSFPIPYYRKIMLDNRNKLKLKKELVQQEPPFPELKDEPVQQERSSESKKKKIKKDKKKRNKKDKKHKKEKKRKHSKEKQSSEEDSESKPVQVKEPPEENKKQNPQKPIEPINKLKAINIGQISEHLKKRKEILKVQAEKMKKEEEKPKESESQEDQVDRATLEELRKKVLQKKQGQNDHS